MNIVFESLRNSCRWGLEVSRISRRAAKRAKGGGEAVRVTRGHLNGGLSDAGLADRLGEAFTNSFIFRLF